MGSSMMKILSYKVNPIILKNNPTIPLFLKIIPLTLFSYRLKSIGISKGKKIIFRSIFHAIVIKDPGYRRVWGCLIDLPWNSPYWQSIALPKSASYHVDTPEHRTIAEERVQTKASLAILI